jgi:AAA domain
MSKPIRADLIEPEDVDWVWPVDASDAENGVHGRIPREHFCVLAGRPKQGKGLLWCRIASDVSRAGGNVLISAWEDSSAITVRPRLEAAGADMEHVFVEDEPWLFPQDIQSGAVEFAIAEHEADLVIIDPWIAHVQGKGGNARALLNPLKGVIEEYGCAFLIIEHVLKKIPRDGGVLAALPGGRSGLPAACRMAFVFGVNPSDIEHRVLCHIGGNLTDDLKPMTFTIDTDEVVVTDVKTGVDKPREFPFLEFDGEMEEAFDPGCLFLKPAQGSKMGAPDDKRKDAVQWLIAYLANAGEPVKSGQLFEDARAKKMAVKTLKRAANEIGVIRNPPGGGRNCTWELPDEVMKLTGREKKKDDDDDGLLTDEDIRKLLAGPGEDDDDEEEDDA